MELGCILAMLGRFRYFCFNSGGRELPGVMVEIDFRPMLEKNGFYNFDVFLLFVFVFVTKIELFMVRTYSVMVPNLYFILFLDPVDG